MAESYPTFRAGQKVTGSLLESMKPQTVRKLSDTGRTSTTASDDPELQFAVEANATYQVDGILWVSATNNTTDVNLDWSAPAGADGSWSGVGMSTSATGVDTDFAGNAGQVRFPLTGITSARSYGATSAGTVSILINALLITSSTAGTYALSWGAVSASGTVTLVTDSYLTLRRIG